MSVYYSKTLLLIRNYHNVTLKDFSGLTGIAISTLSFLENGDRNPLVSHLQCYADTLSIRLSTLIQIAEHIQEGYEITVSTPHEKKVVDTILDINRLKNQIKKH